MSGQGTAGVEEAQQELLKAGFATATATATATVAAAAVEAVVRNRATAHRDEAKRAEQSPWATGADR